jgi:acyl-CoA dehydrogenase
MGGITGSNTLENSAANLARVTSLVAEVEAFIRDVVIPYERDPRVTDHGPTAELVAELRTHARKAGLMAPQVGEAWGGRGLNHLETAAVLRAVGYSPLGATAMNCMAPDEGNMAMMQRIATPAQQERFLRPLAEGRIRSAFLMTEPDGGAGSDPSMLKTVAEQQGGEWVINGRKTFITGADGAGFGIIMAKSGAGATMFLSDMNAPGIRIDRIMDTIDRSMPGGHAMITLDGLRVPNDQILGEVHKGFQYAQVRLAPARLTHCMRWWGTARRAHDVASAYACTRTAFGKPIIDHEGVGFQLADNEIDLKQAELMIDWCASVLDAGGDGNIESSMAKVAVSEALFRVADRSVQVLGGLGVSRDTIAEWAFREIRAFRIYDGTSEVHRWSLAKKLKRRHASGSQGH